MCAPRNVVGYVNAHRTATKFHFYRNVQQAVSACISVDASSFASRLFVCAFISEHCCIQLCRCCCLRILIFCAGCLTICILGACCQYGHTISTKPRQGQIQPVVGALSSLLAASVATPPTDCPVPSVHPPPCTTDSVCCPKNRHLQLTQVHS